MFRGTDGWRRMDFMQLFVKQYWCMAHIFYSLSFVVHTFATFSCIVYSSFILNSVSKIFVAMYILPTLNHNNPALNNLFPNSNK
jgi:hypothetical protein